MKNYLFLLSLTLLSLSSAGRSSPANPSATPYDLVIYGGSSGGFIAAIQAAKMGKSVLLLEPSAHVGGMNVEGLGGTDIDNQSAFQNSPAVGGLALEYYRRIARHYQREAAFETMLETGSKQPELWRFEPKVAQEVIDNWLSEHDITIVHHAPLIEPSEGEESTQPVVKKGAKLQSIRTEQGEFFGHMFIDATIEGDLLAAAQVSTAVGREANSVYGETKNGIREETHHCQIRVKVDPFVVPGQPESGTIVGVVNEALGTPGEGDHRLQAYCFRVSLTNVPENRVPFPKPENYEREDYLLVLRFLQAKGKLYRPRVSLPNGKTDFNGGSDVSHNFNGLNYGWPEGTRRERQQILAEHRDRTQGMFYFIANDPEVKQVAPEIQAYWKEWGLSKDEFTDNEHWPRMFYVRDARRLVSDYVITEHHVRRVNPIPVTDPVGMAYWPPDVHNVRTLVKDGRAYNEGFVFGGNDWIPFGISYRALVPPSAEAQNLLTPTCPSSSHLAYGAIRIEFTFMALGQACATAAAIALDQGCSVQAVDYPTLHQRLLADGQVTSLKDSTTQPSIPEID